MHIEAVVVVSVVFVSATVAAVLDATVGTGLFVNAPRTVDLSVAFFLLLFVNLELGLSFLLLLQFILLLLNMLLLLILGLWVILLWTRGFQPLPTLHYFLSSIKANGNQADIV